MEFVMLFLLTCISSLFIFTFLRSSILRRRGLPPGNLGLPFIGETLHIISAYKTENPEPFVDSRVARFGSLFTTHIFGEMTVFSADPDVNRFILQNEGKFFECSYPSSICNLLGKHSLLLLKGGIHKRLHSLVMSFANSSIIRDSLFVDIDRLIRLNMESWPDRILLMEETKKTTFELAVKQLMSFDPGEWSETLRKEYVLLIEGFFSIPLPLFSPTYRRAINARRKVAEALRQVVQERRKADEGGEIKNDMVGALLAAEDKLSDDEIVDFLVALLVAGYETTSTIMTLAVKFLTETPLALAQLKEEQEDIRARKSEHETLEWSDYKSMPFTQCVVNETLRIANIISGVFRRSTTDIHINGFTISKGLKIFTSFRAVHLGHQHFKDARSFSPWRWQNNSEGTTGSGNIFTPFGGGPRLCPGYELAKVEIAVFLHHLVTRFSWVPTEEDKLVFFPTTRTQKRYPINLHRKSATNTTA